MFNFQGSELIIILLLALVVLGPEKLPEAMRRLGRFYGDLKKVSTSFQEEFRAAVDEPMRELRDTANTLRDSADFRKFTRGERDEKPKSAEMPAAGPDAVPTADVPFGEAPADTTADTTADSADDTVPDAAPQPAPLSSSQTISATAPAVEPQPEPTPQEAVDDEHGLREARPVAERHEDGAA